MNMPGAYLGSKDLTTGADGVPPALGPCFGGEDHSGNVQFRSGRARIR